MYRAAFPRSSSLRYTHPFCSQQLVHPETHVNRNPSINPVGACRTISRFLYPCHKRRRQPFLWAGHYYPALATYPEVEQSGPLLLPYLVLLRVGLALPAELLPPRCALTAPFHPYRTRKSGGLFSVALSVEAAFSDPSRPLAGTLPCGDRTFLPLAGATTRPAICRLHCGTLSAEFEPAQS